MQGWGIPGALGTAELLGLARQRVLENSPSFWVWHVREFWRTQLPCRGTSVYPPHPRHTQGLLTHCLFQNSPPLPSYFP